MKRVDVAVALLQNPQGQVLWAQRPQGKPYPGYWEFPGGKVEPGETVWQALVREIDEELGMKAQEGAPWMVIEHDYPHAQVRLHLYKVWRFEGAPQSREGQSFAWGPLNPLAAGAHDAFAQHVQPILPATEPLLPSLNLPELQWVSQVADLGLEGFIQRMCRSLAVLPAGQDGVLNKGVLIQFREKTLPDTEQARALAAVVQAAQAMNMKDVPVLWSVNADCAGALAWARSGGFERLGVNQWGVHLPQSKWQDLSEGLSPEHADRFPLTAAVHRAEDLLALKTLGAHAAVLGMVQASATHPGQCAIGWEGFAQAVQGTPLPVYAIGGLTMKDVWEAKRRGAHGVAMIRGAWG